MGTLPEDDAAQMALLHAHFYLIGEIAEARPAVEAVYLCMRGRLIAGRDVIHVIGKIAPLCRG
ncbi:hypothetical protein KDA_30750 [Dictyobacter alpinus]|uniref:Uncharacterized protein n=1 Tax=Dictyobacter alpinus TaxID=2014873 RepID=A0A402B891_9CHLR|nr:hypothetical protein KDA_30750 [Dictyobacter alpinus]